MLKLNAGLSRKMGEPGYGSRGASVNLELEVEGHLASEPEALLDRIRRLFALARAAVDEELGDRRNAAPERDGGAKDSSGRDDNGASRSSRPATAAQLKAIRSICERQNCDPDIEARAQFGVGPKELTLRQASALIDALKAPAPATARSR